MDPLISDDDLARARMDPEFRQQFLAMHLERLLEALNALRRSAEIAPDTARQIEEGADLALKLAERLQGTAARNARAA
jgi:hypothetical protein